MEWYNIELATEICSAFSIASDGGNVKKSSNQASFRRDLAIICEASTVSGAQLVLTDDQRFIQNMIKHKPVYNRLIKAIERVFDIKYSLYIRPLQDLSLIHI